MKQWNSSDGYFFSTTLINKGVTSSRKSSNNLTNTSPTWAIDPLSVSFLKTGPFGSSTNPSKIYSSTFLTGYYREKIINNLSSFSNRRWRQKCSRFLTNKTIRFSWIPFRISRPFRSTISIALRFISHWIHSIIRSASAKVSSIFSSRKYTCRSRISIFSSNERASREMRNRSSSKTMPSCRQLCFIFLAYLLWNLFTGWICSGTNIGRKCWWT